MKRYILSLLTVIVCLLARSGAVAQNVLELAAGSASTVLTGPTTTTLSASLLENTTGTTFVVPATPVTVSVSLSNQQYNGTYGNLTTGVVFGAGGNNNGSSAAATALSQPMNTLGSPTSSSFTGSPCGPVGTDIDVASNYALRTFLSTKPLAGKPTTATYQYADLTISFSQPVTNPVLQFVGLGDTFNGGLLGLSTQYFSTQLVLLTSGVTLSKLSGSSELTVLSSTTIANGATQPSANCGSGGACGSVRATGTNITSLTFRVYLRGVGSSTIIILPSAWDANNAHGGDSFLLGVSLDAPPTPTSTTLTNACPATTADLTSIQPAIAGATYEWHTVASGPTSANIVGNTASVNAGTYYLYSLNATNCYSPASAPVTVTQQGCSGAVTCTYLSNSDFEVSGQNPGTYVIGDQSTLVPPWRTTAADGQMELWRTGYQGVPAYSGNQFIELNANLSATTYQNFTAAPGATFTLNFAHRGRSGVDVISVAIGSAIASNITTGTVVTGTVYNNLGNFSDGNTAWGYYTRTFTIPANATGTSFSVRFTTVSSANGDNSAGNFLDAISISDLAPAPTATSLSIVCPATTADLSSLIATNQPVSTTQTFHSGPVATSANRLASTVVGPGTYYTAFFNGQKGCYGATTAIAVTLVTPVAPTVTVTAQPTCTVSTGTITISGPTGAGLTYSIDGINYQNSTIFTAVAPGTYAVTVRNGSTLCTSPATSVTVNASLLTPVAPSVTTIQTNCTLATGTISVTAPTGAGLTYSINGTTYTGTTTFTGVNAGTYAVTVKNATNCVSSPTSVTINTQPATPVATLTSATICNGTGTTLMAGGAGAGGSYLFSTGLTNTTGLLSVTPTANGSNPYSVTATSAQGCPAVASATVTVNAAVTATLTSATFCTNDNAILVATGGSNYAFSNGTSNTSGSLVLSPGVGGTYSVTVTSAQGCSAVATGTVTSQTCSPAGCTNALINPGLESPVVSATNGVGVYYGNSVTGWYAPFASGIGLTRVNGAGYAAGPNNAEDGNQYVFINATGDFLAQNFTLSCASSLNFSGYFANNSTNGSYAPWTAQITILDAGNTIVASSATKTFTSTIGDETWYPLTGSSVVLPAGNYRYYVKVTSSGYFDTANLCITPCPACLTPILNTTAITNACSATTGDLSTITASNTPAGTSLTFHSATPATTANTVSNSVVSGTYYAAFYSASSNCYGPTVPVSVTVIPTPAAPTVSVTQPTCTLATGTITITAPTGTGLTYSINGTTYTASATFSGVATGTYAVTAKNSLNCVSPVTSATVNAQPATPVATLTSATICNGTSTTLVATGGTNYLFSTGLSNITGLLSVSPTTNGSNPYSVTVTSSQGCSAVATGTITVNPSVTATLTSATICTGTSTTLAATGGSSYRFSEGTTSISGILLVAPISNGANLYSVTVTSSQGCTAVASGTVTVNALPQPTILGSTSVCAGQPISLTASPTTGVAYAWSGPGGNLGSANPLTIASSTLANAGTYQVKVTDANGCTAVATKNVVIYALPVATLTVNSATMCYGQPISLTAGGGVSYTFSGNVTGVSGNTASFTAALGTAPYSVTVTSGQGCLSAPATVTVTVVSCVYPAPDSGTASAGTGGTAVANVTANDLINTAPATLGVNGNATIAAIGTYPPGITVNPATGSVSVTAGVAVPGSYTIAYQLCDKLTPVTCATTTVAITVLSTINPLPDSGTVASGTGGVAVTNVVTNDLVDGAPARLGMGGNATIAAIGTYVPGITLNPATGSVSVAVGTPPGTYTVGYQLCNLVSPVTCATTIVMVTVTPAPPVATGDINSVNINTSVLGNVLTNDYDPQGLLLTASLTTSPTAGTLVFSANGNYTYTPPVDFTGLASFMYTICNSASLCATTTATINVLPNPTVGNNAPVARNDATRTRLGQPVRIAILANDTDPDAAASANGQLTNPVLLSQPASGTAVVNSDRSVTYTPAAGFTGVVSFPYQVCDKASSPLCSTALVTVNVLPPVLAGTVLAPVGVDDALLTKINTPATGNVSTNDSDANSPILSLTYTTGQPGSGTVVMSATGSYTYTPATGFAGPTSFTYSVCNTGGLCSAATVNIVVQRIDKVGLLAKVYLQGALLGIYGPSVLMRDDLRAKGLLPATSPYSGFGSLTQTGSLSASVTAVTGNDAIVDWVFVELRSPASNTLVIDSRSALLQRDGDIVDVDGVSPVRFDVALAGGYYVVIRHRNHLGVMTGLSVPLSVSASVVDFRSASTPTFSYTASSLNQAQVVVDQGVAVWAGNALSDNLPTAPHEQILFQGTNNDVNAIYQRSIAAPGNLFVSPFYKLKGYYSTDLDLNGETQFQGSGNDVETIYQNIIKNHPGNSLVAPNFIIREQLP